jgi:hypothetical protein
VGQFEFYEAISKEKKSFSQRRHGATLKIVPYSLRRYAVARKIIFFETASFNLYYFQTNPLPIF